MSYSDCYIEREKSTNQGTFGRLYCNGFSCHTLELPWKNNARNVSCIPKGKYKTKWTWSPKFGRMMYLVAKVPNRSGIRIHSANFAGDTSKGYKSHLYGCITLGKRRGVLEGQKAVLVSRPTVRKFEKLLGKEEFDLEIK